MLHLVTLLTFSTRSIGVLPREVLATTTAHLAVSQSPLSLLSAKPTVPHFPWRFHCEGKLRQPYSCSRSMYAVHVFTNLLLQLPMVAVSTTSAGGSFLFPTIFTGNTNYVSSSSYYSRYFSCLSYRVSLYRISIVNLQDISAIVFQYLALSICIIYSNPCIFHLCIWRKLVSHARNWKSTSSIPISIFYSKNVLA